MKFEMYHSCITVFNLEKSMDFYEKALGLKEIRRIDGEDGAYKIVFMGTDNGHCQLELTWYKERKEPYDLGENESHIGFRVDDYNKAYDFHKENNWICMENEKMGIYFIEDPDGYWMEIVPTR